MRSSGDLDIGIVRRVERGSGFDGQATVEREVIEEFGADWTTTLGETDAICKILEEQVNATQYNDVVLDLL